MHCAPFACDNHAKGKCPRGDAKSINWAVVFTVQVKKIVGGSAPEHFKGEVRKLADEHHDALNVDSVKAYHFGSRFNVEMEVILPADMTVAESHDIAVDLQHKV